MAPAQLPQELYLNRELSWIRFNQRVLAQALNPRTPLLEQRFQLVADLIELLPWREAIFTECLHTGMQL